MKMSYLIHLNLGKVPVKRTPPCEAYSMCTEHFWLAEGFLNKMDDRPIPGDRRKAREWRVKSWHVPGEFIAHVPPAAVIDHLAQNQPRGTRTYSACYNVDSRVN